MICRLARPVLTAARTPALSQKTYAKGPTSLFRSLATTTTSYTMAPVPPADRRPLVISGPSGVGKGTLFKLLFARHPETFTLSVSHTTRSPRAGEQDGVDYHFVTHTGFEDLISQDGFVEHAQFGGNRYGTSKSTIREQTDKGKVVLLDIEMEGVKQIKQSDIAARFVFVAPPSEEELERRLRGRGTEKEESIQKRLAQAKYVPDSPLANLVEPLLTSAPAGWSSSTPRFLGSTTSS